jgi:hypothetical protein
MTVTAKSVTVGATGRIGERRCPRFRIAIWVANLAYVRRIGVVLFEVATSDRALARSTNTVVAAFARWTTPSGAALLKGEITAFPCVRSRRPGVQADVGITNLTGVVRIDRPRVAIGALDFTMRTTIFAEA